MDLVDKKFTTTLTDFVEVEDEAFARQRRCPRDPRAGKALKLPAPKLRAPEKALKAPSAKAPRARESSKAPSAKAPHAKEALKNLTPKVLTRNNAEEICDISFYWPFLLSLLLFAWL